MSLALAAFLGGVAIAAPGRSSLTPSSEAHGSVDDPAAAEALGAAQQIGAPARAGQSTGSDVASDARPLRHGWPLASGGGGHASSVRSDTFRDHNDEPDHGGQGANTEPVGHGADQGDAGRAPDGPPSNEPNRPSSNQPDAPNRPQQPLNPDQAAPQGERHGDQQGSSLPQAADPGANGGSGPSHRV